MKKSVVEDKDMIMRNSRVQLNFQDVGSTVSRAIFHQRIKKIPAVTLFHSPTDRGNRQAIKWWANFGPVLALNNRKLLWPKKH